MIPQMNASSVLPPFTGPDPTSLATTSPYVVAISEVVDRFATSIERIAILRGLLSYRQKLISLGLTDGHMWLDGSFVEDVEIFRRRPPEDIDVVTFATVPGVDKPAKQMFAKTHIDIFFPGEAKKTYMCDAYFVDLSSSPLALVNQTRYWFGLFSHQRETNLWKGILQVPLQSDDVAAQDLLNMKEQGLGGPQNA